MREYCEVGGAHIPDSTLDLRFAWEDSAWKLGEVLCFEAGLVLQRSISLTNSFLEVD